MDDLQGIIKSGNGIVGGTRRFAVIPVKSTEQVEKAVGIGLILKELMLHGKWVKISSVLDVCGKSRFCFLELAAAAGLCQSDSGKWCCIPNDNTPLLPPDEEKKEDNSHE